MKKKEYIVPRATSLYIAPVSIVAHSSDFEISYETTDDDANMSNTQRPENKDLWNSGW